MCPSSAPSVPVKPMYRQEKMLLHLGRVRQTPRPPQSPYEGAETRWSVPTNKLNPLLTVILRALPEESHAGVFLNEQRLDKDETHCQEILRLRSE